MMMIRTAAACLSMVSLLAGCAHDGPAANGDTVRAIMASQMLPPQARGAAGTDAVATGAALQNYRQSYVAPTPQGDATLLGNKK